GSRRDIFATSATKLRIVRRASFQHCDKCRQQTIGNSAERPAVAMSTSTQGGIMLAAAGIFLQAAAGPMIKGVPQPPIAGIAHDHHLLFAALTGNGSQPAIAAQAVIVSLSEAPRGLAKHRGGDPDPQTWPGKE